MGKNDFQSIFNRNHYTAEFMKSIQDLTAFAAVMQNFNTEYNYESSVSMIQFLNIVHLLNKAALKIEESIANEDMLYERYREYYQDDVEPPTLQQIKQMIHSLERNYWIIRHTSYLELTERGKRLIDGVVRMGNEALVYHQQEPIESQLFQAKRDADLSKAYDDYGISGYYKMESMVHNIEAVVQKLEEQQFELLVNCDGLLQLERMNTLMQELEHIVKERLTTLQLINASIFSPTIVQRGTIAIEKGRQLSATILQKYKYFLKIRKIEEEKTISSKSIRPFILDMYGQFGNLTSHDLFSFMEQDDLLDGMWMPVKFAAPIGEQDIQEALVYLEAGDSQFDLPINEQEEVVYEEFKVNDQSVSKMLEGATWSIAKTQIDTSKMERHLKLFGEIEIEELVVETSSNKWHHAVSSMLALSTLTSNHKIVKKTKQQTKNFNREWEWIEDDNKQYTVRKLINNDE